MTSSQNDFTTQLESLERKGWPLIEKGATIIKQTLPFDINVVKSIDDISSAP